MRALVYVRVSTAGQAERYSLATQRELCDQKARQLGAVSVEVLSDTHTGTELDRPAMDELRRKVENGAVDLIVAYDPDRFSRDLVDLLVVTREIDAAGVKLQFVNFDWEHSPQGVLFLQMRGAIAQFEHALIRERTARGKRKKAASGKLRTQAGTYGYRFDRDSDQLEIVEETAAVVKLIFRLYVHHQLSTREVADRLNGMGVPAPKGRRWLGSTVYRMLRNETYAGRLWRVDEQPDWQPLLTPVIVDREMFGQAQSLLSRTRRGGRRRYKYLLRGLVVCGECGQAVWGRGQRKGGRVYRYYHCSRRYGDRKCGLSPINAQELEEEVWLEVAGVLRNADVYAQGTEIIAIERQRWEERRQEVCGWLERVEGALERVWRAWFGGHVCEEERQRYEGEFSVERERLWEELRVLENKLGELDRGREIGDGVDEVIDCLNWEQRQGVVRELVERVVVRNGMVEIWGCM